MKENENVFNPEAETKMRLEKCAKDAQQNIERVFGQGAEFLKMFQSRQMLRGARRLIKGYLGDYRGAAHAKVEKEINVELPIDSKIPFEPKALPTYASHIGLLVHGVNFSRKEFGKEAEKDILKFSDDVVEIFPQASEVFKNTQTYFTRAKGEGFGMKILQAIDSEKNACPSIHVEIAALTYSRIFDILEAHAKDKEAYGPMKEFYFNQAVKILESVLVVKQHVVMDVGVALGALSGMDKAFTPKRVEKMVNAMFEKQSYGMDKQIVDEVRKTILSIYNEITAKILSNPKIPTSNVVVGYLKDFDEKKNQF